MKLIIAGSRTVSPTPQEIDMAIESFHDQMRDSLCSFTPVAEIVSGTANGADQAGEEYASSRGHEIKRFPADWDKHGKAAGKLRNREMAEYADAALVFWDGMSSGSCDMVTRMVVRGKPVRVVPMRRKS